MLFPVCVNSVDCSDFPASQKFSMWRHKGFAVAGKSPPIHRGIRGVASEGRVYLLHAAENYAPTEALSYNFLPGTGGRPQRLGSRQQGCER